MALEGTYLIKSVSYKSTAITGLQNVSIRQNGEVTAYGSGDNLTVTAHFMDDIEGEVDIETSDVNALTTANFQPGESGSLVITMEKRSQGKVVGSGRTITAANAMVGTHDAAIPRSGVSSATISLHCSDPNGAAVFAFADVA